MPLFVHKKQKESVGAFLRRFSRVVQHSKVLVRVRNNQFRKRPLTERLEKYNAIRRAEKHVKMEKLRKLGKVE
ncbi:MAG: hypothetical protein COU90_01630 [Candidatus Ryanbacteria bacterium CG10_big_fil_rev_8_21_14_0_10_43_42]|uniref:30S ribosomal protein S21 n=1 Tax=Candidatus Ryanbacteria bacterium CG10_big_fil_rev_8_21_14_0_10_43_42 TaxID=1974864 RepID=A0A2M8KX65_9BACT|nr:MAG: hypothetical protein COU90_01630 [Candidatus Ryanbacteria bacterium CG10_big_fil_rev_8_21_14_0_10_43_42]